MHLYRVAFVYYSCLVSLVHSVRRVPLEFSKVDEFLEENQSRRNLQLAVEENVALPSQESHLVTNLPFLNEPNFVKHYAGHVPASAEERKLFYWMFEPPSFNDETPLVIWLNGGPGCSSMDGLFLENGPLRLKNDGKNWRIELNEFSWNNLPSFSMYVDQPVGTGLSFTRRKKYCSSDEMINIDFYFFLQNFFKVHRSLFLTEDGKRLKRKFFFAGESHAGHFIPTIVDHILAQNEIAPQKNRIVMPVTGAAIGNGWIDPYHQYAAATAAYGEGLIDMAQYEFLNQKEKECQAEIDNGNLHASICFKLLDLVIDDSNGDKTNVRASPYDTRRWELYHHEREFPPGHKEVESYLGSFAQNSYVKKTSPPMRSKISEEVLTAIHATEATDAGQYYMECTDPPYFALQKQDAKGVVNEIVRILSHPSKPTLLFFNGMNDLMCNHVGNERLLNELPWEHAKDWVTSKRYAWSLTPSNKDLRPPVGYVKKFQNLIFLKVKNSGHMVPLDVPDVAFEMMKRLLQNPNSFTNVGEQTNIGMKEPGDLGLCDKCTDCKHEKCPVCPKNELVSNVISPSQVKENISSSSTQQLQNEISNSSNSIMQGAYIGASAALVLIIFISLWQYSKRNKSMQVETASSDFEFATSVSRSEYRDNPETGLSLT